MSDSTLLDTLDRLPKVRDKLMQLRQFDAFPKTQPSYVRRTSRGGFVTVVLAIAMLIMIWVEASSYLQGEHDVTFHVDSHISKMLQINLDMTVATPCSSTCWGSDTELSVGLRDASGDSVEFDENAFAKDGTSFRAQVNLARAKRRKMNQLNALDAPRLSGQVTRTNKKFRQKGPRDKQSGFAPTYPLVRSEPACRIYGSVLTKKVTGNLHISALNPLFLVGQHDINVNMSHIITELSFGPHFPYMAEPLDASMEVTSDVIPTNYFKSKQEVRTNQYSVADYKRYPNGPAAFPGVFFKYDIEPLTMSIHNRSMSFVAFLVRLAGVLGGVWLCTHYAFRTVQRILLVLKRSPSGQRVLDSLRISTGLDTPYTQPHAPPQDGWGSTSGMYDHGYAASVPSYQLRQGTFATQRAPSGGY